MSDVRAFGEICAPDFIGVQRLLWMENQLRLLFISNVAYVAVVVFVHAATAFTSTTAIADVVRVH